MHLSLEKLTLILQDERLSSTSRILLQEIVKLLSSDWTKVTNKQLKDKIKKSDSTINRLISQLVKLGYLERKCQMMPGATMPLKIRYLKMGTCLNQLLKNDTLGRLKVDHSTTFKNDSFEAINSELDSFTNYEDSGSANTGTFNFVKPSSVEAGGSDSYDKSNSSRCVISSNEPFLKNKRNNILSFNKVQKCSFQLPLLENDGRE